MNKRIVRAVGLMLVIGLAGLSASAQKREVVPDPPRVPKSCTCFGNGLRCLFGTAQGCSLTCYAPTRCDCEGARCIFGFPISSSCTCL